MEVFKSFKKGISSQSVSAVNSLLWNYIKKQAGLWTVLSLIWLMLVLTIIGYGVDSEYYSSEELKFMANFIVIIGSALTLLVVTTFCISTTLNSIHKSTMIKRIGATRLTEQSFVLITWTYFFVFSCILFLSTYAILSILTWIAFKSFYITGIAKTLIFSIFMLAMFVSIGVFLGVLPIGTAASIVISIAVMLLAIFFGGFFPFIVNAISYKIPVIATSILILNPIGFTSYILYSVSSGTANLVLYTAGLIYTVSVGLTLFFGSSLVMSFNKVR